MDSVFSKPFDEEFARLCIETCFSDFGWSMELNECDPPDIIDREHNIGIEVTRSISKLDAQIASAFADNRGKKKSEIKEGLLKKIDSDSYGFIYDKDNSGEVIIGASLPVKPGLYSEIRNALIKKTQKLNNGKYPHFNKDVLFILNTDGFCFEDGLKAIIEEIAEELSDCIRHYSTLFVYCGKCIFCYNKDRGIEKRELSASLNESIKLQAITNIGRKEEYNKKLNT